MTVVKAHTEPLQDWTEANSFVVSGLMNECYPIDDAGNAVYPRVSSKRVFDSYESAEEWAHGAYDHVYQNLCDPKLGMWAFRVSRK
jgi:hypothetical protein